MENYLMKTMLEKKITALVLGDPQPDGVPPDPLNYRNLPKEKIVICAPGTDLGPWSLEDICAGRAKKVFYLQTEKAIYAANDPNSLLTEWKARSTTNFVQVAEDDSNVIEISSIG
jgi:hypothetical protein